MPWKVVPKNDGFVVVDDTGKEYSKRPMPKWRAQAQMRSLYAGEPAAKASKSFRVFKQADGAYRWVTISSSAFKDRDGEIITTEALAQDVERCDTNKQYGPLRWWHIGGWEAPDGIERWDTWKATAGVDLGQCDFNMLHGKMLIESGVFKDQVTGEAFAECQGNLEVSIAFAHPPNEPGETKQYKNIHRFERSLLPAGMASNLLTKTYVLKGETMKAQEKLAALVAILRGKPDLAAAILTDAENVQKAAEEVGLEFKDVQEMLSVEPEEKAEESPAAEVAEVEGTENVIGDMSREDLTSYITEVVKQLLTPQAEAAQAKETSTTQVIADALISLKTLAERTQVVEHTLAETKQALAELTDARPVGIKNLQSNRPTERLDNVIKTAPAGPRMDETFVNFMQGGK